MKTILAIFAIAMLAEGALAATWEDFRTSQQHYDTEVYEAARLTENYRYIANHSGYVKTLDQFMKDGGGDCDDFTYVWRLYLLSVGVPETAIQTHQLRNRNGTYHEVLIVGDYVLSAGEDVQGVHEMSYLELWK